MRSDHPWDSPGRLDSPARAGESAQDPNPIQVPIHPAALDPEVVARQCDFRVTRRSGPGGQNRNKVETAVILTHRPTGLRSEASERRTQGENRRTALFRLRIELALGVRRLIAAEAIRPSALWQARCPGGRIVVNPRHEDFPALLAEALDVLRAFGDDPRAAAESLGCSPSQLIKFLKEEPRAWIQLNARRRQSGQHPLH
jgi:hypothetical protein